MALAASNNRIKELRRLIGRRSSRVESGRFVIEGPVLVDEAIAAGIEISEVFVDERWAIETGWRPCDVGRESDVVEVMAGVLASVLSTAMPQPVCAVAAFVDHDLGGLMARCVTERRPLLVLAEVADPGNVGTILRAAEASGCGGVVLSSGSADLYSPKTVRASAGSMFRLPVAVDDEVATILAVARDGGMTTCASVTRGGCPHLHARLDGAVALVMGNEAHGLSDEVIDACDEAVSITMDGPAESLNVAMAATVLVFEALRQRTTSPGSDPLR